MAKRWSVTSLVALAVLGCLFGTNVEAQGSTWQKPAPPTMTKGAPPPQVPRLQVPQAPQYAKYPETRPQVLPPVQKTPQYDERPQVFPLQPQYPKTPQIQPPPPQKTPQYDERPQVFPLQPQYPKTPQIQPPPPQKTTQYDERPQVFPLQPQYPKTPQIQPPPPQKTPQYDERPQVFPLRPQYPKTPQIQPPPPQKTPQYDERPQVFPLQPQYPKTPQIQPPPPQKTPQYDERPQVFPLRPQYPKTPQIQPPPPQKRVPQYDERPQVFPLQPQYPKTPQIQPPPPQKTTQYDERPQVFPLQPQYPKTPQIQPPPPQKRVPQYPKTPQIQPPPPQKRVPQYSQMPQQPQRQAPQYSASPRTYPDSQSPHEPQDPQDPQPYQPYQPHKPNQPQEPHQPYQPYQPQQPNTSPQAPHKLSVSKQPAFQSCEVAEGQKIPCGGSGISAAECEAISCCFDGRQCHFGRAVTVQCTKDAQFIIVVARDATLPNIDLESISLLGQGQGCTHVDSNSGFAIYQFPVTACGSVVMEEPGVIIYENRMTSSFEVGVGDRGVITRDSYYELLFQCRYIGVSVETVVVEVLPLQDPPLPVAALGPIRVHLRLANGQCSSKGCNEVDAAYTSFYTEADYPVTKVLREPVFVEVQLIEKTDPNLVLTLGHCWTTTSSNPHSLPQWDILIDGCPYRDDRYLSSLIPVDSFSGLNFPSHYRRFLFKMFTFVNPNTMEPLKELVYIHCSTAVCSPAAGQSCEPSCFRRKRDVKAAEPRKAEPKVVVSIGPVIVSAEQ